MVAGSKDHKAVDKVVGEEEYSYEEDSYQSNLVVDHEVCPYLVPFPFDYPFFFPLSVIYYVLETDDTIFHLGTFLLGTYLLGIFLLEIFLEETGYDCTNEIETNDACFFSDEKTTDYFDEASEILIEVNENDVSMMLYSQ